MGLAWLLFHCRTIGVPRSNSVGQGVADSSHRSRCSIPMDSYSSSIEQQTSLDRPELPGSMEQTSMSRSQSAPMLDDELGFPGHGHGHGNQNQQNQKPAIPQKAYHFDHNYNPQVSSISLLLEGGNSDL